MLLLSSFSVLSRDTVFLSDEHSPPQIPCLYRSCARLAIHHSQLRPSDMDVVQYSASLNPSSLSIRLNRTPGTSGFDLERAQKQRGGSSLAT